MQIKIGDKFEKFEGFSKKLADTVKVVFDNSTLVCSLDHRFKDTDNRDIFAKDLKRGIQVKNNQFGTSTVIQVIELGKREVFTPVNVENGLYETTNGIINHNCSFIGSSSTLIPSEVLETLVEAEPIEVMFEDMSFNVYSKPKPNALYVMGIDCSSGVANDYSCIQVLEIRGRNDMEQVGTYRSNTVKIGEFSRRIDYISKMYNNALFILENNDVGKQVAEEVWYTLENTNLINTEKAGRGLGTKADKRSKLDACMELQRVMDAKILKLHDGVTIAELSRFEEQNTANVFKGAKGTHDDTVTALYWAVYATLQPEIDLDNIKVIEETKVQDEMTIDMIADANEYNNDFWADFK